MNALTIDYHLTLDDAIRQWVALGGLSPAQLYARWYNSRHPTRKISWRRLTRKQMAEGWRFDPVACYLINEYCKAEERQILEGVGLKPILDDSGRTLPYQQWLLP